MNTTVTPQMPVENWEQVRDEWIAEVEKMAGDVERWAKENDWDTKREMKELEEYGIGTYEVPVVRVQTMQGRGTDFDPIARFVGGGDGRIDIIATPSFYQLVVVKVDGAWRFMTEEEMDDMGKRWSHEDFTEAVTSLLKRKWKNATCELAG